MSEKKVFSAPCPHCNGAIAARNPFPTVDVVLHRPESGVLLIERRNPPYGWALPGGFVDYGESVEHAAVRECQEETGLEVRLTDLLGVYSDPGRDPRFHTLSVVFTAEDDHKTCPCAGDDAKNARFFPLESLPAEIAFDHLRIINDFVKKLRRSA
ncbi:MAG: NUDIX hydrolase [Desulfovibrionales bacterium]|nr:NUDIX hydrolase [Desulfovibrionales bacterium]